MADTDLTTRARAVLFTGQMLDDLTALLAAWDSWDGRSPGSRAAIRLRRDLRGEPGYTRAWFPPTSQATRGALYDKVLADIYHGPSACLCCGRLLTEGAVK